MNIEEAFEGVLKGDAILFLGAGFSKNAINRSGGNLRIGGDLAKYLCEQIGIKQISLDLAAEEFIEQKGRYVLLELLKNEFSVSKPTEAQVAIAALPWKRVYTTNYDNAFEKAAETRNGNKLINAVTLSTPMSNLGSKKNLCIHLNGYINNITPDKINDELKLSETSYVTSSIEFTPWAQMFRNDINTASAVIFLGYSLYDLDIKRILAADKASVGKTFFYLGNSPTDDTLMRVKHYGAILDTQTTDDFARGISIYAKRYVPPPVSKTRKFISLDEYISPAFRAKKPSDSDFINLLMWGQRTPELISESIQSDAEYYLCRAKLNEALRLLRNGTRVLVVCSDMGNGKSLFIEGLKYKAKEQGYRVFSSRFSSEEACREVSRFDGIEESSLLILEEYQDRLREIETFLQNASPNASIVLTARNAIHDNRIPQLMRLIPKESIYNEINLDVLEKSELDWIITAIDAHGLWGKMAGERYQYKMAHLERDCHGQFHAILLDILESPDIKNRLEQMIAKIQTRGVNHEILISIFILSVINHEPSLNVLVDIWGAERIETDRFKHDQSLRDFISVNYSECRVRSSIIAQKLLKLCDPALIVKILIQMETSITTGITDIRPDYRDLSKKLMMFHILQDLFSSDKQNISILQYYEDIKHLCSRRALFWLQYAMAAMAVNDLDRAEKYLDTAYSIGAKLDKWDNFQIDNQKAKLHLLQTLASGITVNDAFDKYREADTILEAQMIRENAWYPFRVSALIWDFVSVFKNKLSDVQKSDISSAAGRILDRIVAAPDYLQKHQAVIACKRSMLLIIEQIGKHG